MLIIDMSRGEGRIVKVAHRRTRTQKTTPARLIALLGAALLTVAACSPATSQPDQGERPLRVVTSFQVHNLNPLEQGFWAVAWGLGERLMRPTESGTVEPWLLSAIEPTSSQEWELTLRPDVTFHNGTALDAAALTRTIKRHLDDKPEVTAALPGAEVTSEGERTVRLRTSQPVPNLPHLLADQHLITVFDVDAADRAGNSDAELARAGIYTGPLLARSLTSTALTLERNDGYWGGEVALPGVTVRFVDDGNARVQAVRSGEADLAFYPPTDVVRSLSDDRVAVRDSPIATSQLRGFVNQSRAPLDDVNVRRALSLAIDRRELAEDALDGLYRAPTSMYTSDMPYSLDLVRTDVKLARELLDDAGWRTRDGDVRSKDGTDLAITILSYSTQPDTRAIATAMQAQLAKVGFRAEITDVPANYAAMENPDRWHVGLSFDSALGYSFDPVRPLRTFEHSDGEYNFGQIRDTTLDSMIDKLTRTFDEEERNDLLRSIQRIIVDERAHTLFITERPARVVAGPGWHDYVPSSVLLNVTADTAPSR